MPPAACQFPFDWPATCVPPDEHPHGALAPPWYWSMSWPVRLPFTAFASASAEFDCSTSPLSPGLNTRIPTAVFDGFSCAASAPASADWSLSFFWPATCVPEPEPPCDWSIDWPVRLPFTAFASASAEFDCSTSPLSPGLNTRIPTAVFDGFSCTAAAPASADWSLSFDWPATCVPPVPQPHFAASESLTGAAEPPWDWSMSCPVRLPFTAFASPSAEFDCVTS